MHIFSFCDVIPVKSFELTLTSKSLHLYRQKSGGGGEAGLKYSSNSYILKYSRLYCTVYTKLFTLVQT